MFAKEKDELSRLQYVSSYVAVGVSGFIVLIPLAHRLGVVPLGMAFVCFAIGVVVGLVSALVIGVSLIRNGVKSFATMALVIVGCVVAVPLMSILAAVGAPAIHDITTDVSDPPQFIEAVQLSLIHI